MMQSVSKFEREKKLYTLNIITFYQTYLKCYPPVNCLELIQSMINDLVVWDKPAHVQ